MPPEVEPAQAHIDPRKIRTMLGSIDQDALSTTAKPEVVAMHIVWKAPSQRAFPIVGSNPCRFSVTAMNKVKNTRLPR